MENNLGKRLKLARTNKSYTQQELSEIIGVTKQAVTNYETNKRKPSSDLLLKICDALDVSMDYLFGMNTKTPDDLQNLDGQKSVGNAEIPETQGNKKLPVFESAAAGPGAEPLTEPVEFILPPPNKKGDMWIIVRGDSMEPRIFDGDYVLVDKSAEVKNNDTVIAIVDGEVFCKIYYKDADGKISLYSQTTKYPPIRQNGEVQFVIVGKVVGFFGSM